jgi:hypothetical protein
MKTLLHCVTLFALLAGGSACASGPRHKPSINVQGDGNVVGSPAPAANDAAPGVQRIVRGGQMDPRTMASIAGCRDQVLYEVQGAIDARGERAVAAAQIDQLQKRIAELEAQLPKKDAKDKKEPSGSAPTPDAPPGAAPVDSKEHAQ